MVFIPRLPTWDTPALRYAYDPLTESWSSAELIEGQVYFPHRGQPGTLFGALYFSYPKEDDVLVDPADYGLDVWLSSPPPADILAFDHPTNDPITVYYWVLQIAPRWLGFPNEYRMAMLKRLTAEEVAETVDAPPPPPESPPQWVLSDVDATDADCLDCEALNINFSLWNIASETWQSDPFEWSCSTSVDGNIQWWAQRNVVGEQLVLLMHDADDFGTTHVGYIGDLAGWNGTDPVVCDIQPGPYPLCNFPATITITPD